jgi:hypothetical protein
MRIAILIEIRINAFIRGDTASASLYKKKSLTMYEDFLYTLNICTGFGIPHSYTRAAG